jgi:hypothetical protein
MHVVAATWLPRRNKSTNSTYLFDTKIEPFVHGIKSDLRSFPEGVTDDSEHGKVLDMYEYSECQNGPQFGRPTCFNQNFALVVITDYITFSVALTRWVWNFPMYNYNSFFGCLSYLKCRLWKRSWKFTHWSWLGHRIEAKKENSRIVVYEDALIRSSLERSRHPAEVMSSLVTRVTIPCNVLTWMKKEYSSTQGYYGTVLEQFNT